MDDRTRLMTPDDGFVSSGRYEDVSVVENDTGQILSATISMPPADVRKTLIVKWSDGRGGSVAEFRVRAHNRTDKQLIEQLKTRNAHLAAGILVAGAMAQETGDLMAKSAAMIDELQVAVDENPDGIKDVLTEYRIYVETAAAKITQLGAKFEQVMK